MGSSDVIGHVALEADNPFFFDLCRALDSAAVAAGYSVLLGNSSGSIALEERYMNLFEAERVRGLILTATASSSERIAQIVRAGTPVVAVDRPLSADVCSSVSVNDYHGGRLAIQHLIECGSRNILFVGGPLDLYPVAQRLAGARELVEESGFARLEVLEVTERSIMTGRRVGEVIADAARVPDAVFAVNDLVAIGVLHGLLAKGRRVPEEISVIGYDDIDFAIDAIVPLTSIRRPGRLLGETAFRLVEKMVEDPGAPYTRIDFDPRLIVRSSTGG